VSVASFRSRIAAACSAASGRPGALWVQGACLAAAGALAWKAAGRWAHPGGGLEEARRLGIISTATLAGYPTDRDAKAYAILLAVTLVAGVAFWVLWSVLAREAVPAGQPARSWQDDAPRWSRWEILALTGVLLLGLLRFDLAANGWDAPFTFYSEEGEALAWVQVVLHGGVLTRDVYCAYGPLFTGAIVLAFKMFGASVFVWRIALYLLDVPALLAVYAVLRELGRSRRVAAFGVAIVLFLRMWPLPAMSWSLLRAGLGLAALAAIGRFLRRRDAGSLALAGVALGCGVFYSQEAGVAAAIAAVAALLLDRAAAFGPRRRLAANLAILVAGMAAVVLPVVGWYAAEGALPSLLGNLFGFARLRTLGHGALPFPSLVEDAAAYVAAPSPATADAFRETLAVYLGPALCALAAFRSAVSVAAGSASRDTILTAALAIYGAVLFASPLSRPDATHVYLALPPALVLATDLLARAALGVRGRAVPLAKRLPRAIAVVTLIGILTALPTDLADNVRIFVRQVGLNVTLRGTGPADPGTRALELPRAGGIRVPADRADEIEGAVRYVLDRTGPDEPLWAAPDEPMLNFLADRPFASPFPNGFFAITARQRADLVAAVERSALRYAIVNEKPSLIDGLPSRTLSPEIWAEIDSRFALERRFGRLAVVRRSVEATRSGASDPRRSPA
jgi:hypothetical protein